jgi:hypothetical protein
MPTITYHRVWCKNCQEYQLFHKSKCIECGIEHVPTKYKDIPKDKIMEQRERYKKSKSNAFNKLLNVYTNPASIMFSAMEFEKDIIESDAGQKYIDDLKKQEQTERLNIYKKQKKDFLVELEKYTNIKRNDICICGSNKKYKKCCLSKIQSNILKFNL